jgi:(p)ppGpp synthase/HD superfamily hydrolase
VSSTHLPLIYSGRVRRALQLAERSHRGMNRKSGDHPYLLHPVAVATVLSAAGADDDLLCAAYLHDAVEDTELTLLAIEDEFGSRVARLVAGVTKTDTDERGAVLSREDKHRLVEERMADPETGIDEVALKGADLLTNISDLIMDQAQFGYAHWQEVFKGLERADFKLGHYLRLADIIVGRLAAAGAYPVLAEHLRARAGQLRDVRNAWQR